MERLSRQPGEPHREPAPHGEPAVQLHGLATVNRLAIASDIARGQKSLEPQQGHATELLYLLVIPHQVRRLLWWTGRGVKQLIQASVRGSIVEDIAHAGAEQAVDPEVDLPLILLLNQVRKLLRERIEQFHKRHPAFISAHDLRLRRESFAPRHRLRPSRPSLSAWGLPHHHQGHRWTSTAARVRSWAWDAVVWLPDMGEQGTRDLDTKRRHPRQLTNAEREQMAKEVLTEGERQVFRLLVRGYPRKEIAAELNLSDGAVLQHVLSILAKLGPTGSPPDPSPPPLAASAALAVPLQRPEDVPTHVGKPLRRTSSSAVQVV